ncbi:hypothetical protein FGO68_gene943 [Halteria grandinella]|uniref:Uncharacterized protein n=1 Tax=Halteria grandinella TaxID=5974 RepID=A0A8J8P3V2_HALGN|nr:hypothetical protein FGO68_gene943 [Halteria grandinella]
MGIDYYKAHPYFNIKLHLFTDDIQNLYINANNQTYLEVYSRVILHLEISIEDSRVRNELMKLNNNNFKAWVREVKITSRFCPFFRIKDELIAIVGKYFHPIKSCSFDANLSDVKEKANFYKFFSLKSTSINKFAQFKLRTCEIIWISIKFLETVRHLHLISLEDSQFKLKFEDLQIEYPKTKFTIEFSSGFNASISDAYQKCPHLFKTQCCDIIINNCLLVYMDVIDSIKNLFPQNTIELCVSQETKLFSPILSKFAKQLESINNQLTMNVEQYLGLNITQYKGTLQINNINLHQKKKDKKGDQFLCIKSLKKFKIKEKFELHFLNSKFLINFSNLQIESPPTICIMSEERQDDCTCMIQGVLKGFCNQQNVKVLQITVPKGQYKCQSSFILLYQEVKNFTNLTELRIPMGYYPTAIRDIKAMLKDKTKLSSLYLYQASYGENYSQIVHSIIQFSIENLREIELISISVYTPIKVNKFQFVHRAKPLTISINGMPDAPWRVQYTFDSRTGFAQYQDNAL